ncbi:hypothetical protein ElyMa_003004700 [Elysia marginata]|uniref:Uncharacterized protein n=1 Tax=Elysia marginata TaxID=1093978 RepID=A0AAV4IC11_9GAST|nr:hypothetical protein ElyMa_003004700 [Elysia marginata]
MTKINTDATRWYLPSLSLRGENMYSSSRPSAKPVSWATLRVLPGRCLPKEWTPGSRPPDRPDDHVRCGIRMMLYVVKCHGRETMLMMMMVMMMMMMMVVVVTMMVVMMIMMMMMMVMLVILIMAKKDDVGIISC